VTAVAFEAERWYADKGRPVAALEHLDALDALELVRVRFADRGETLYALVPNQPRWEALLAGARGRFSFDGQLPTGRDERLPVDQSHTSWRVGDACVKCYRRLTVGINPEVELLRVLTEQQFGHVPAYRGALQWESPSGHVVSVALLTEFVENGAEGWEWVAELALAGDPSFAAELGALARALHETLAAALPMRVATTADTDTWHRRAGEQLDRALAIAPELREHDARLRSELAGLTHLADPPSVARVHGDLHVGQFLRAGDRLLIVDFEGQPAKNADERRAPDTQLRDLASLARSLDHCGRYAVERYGADLVRTEAWIADARERLVGAYGDCDRTLLRALEWERAIYEFTYAVTYLPEWMFAPRGGLNALLREQR
jgi:predicted trehalose synthase